jgi:mannan endo-1,4-beta-mannosidase
MKYRLKIKILSALLIIISSIEGISQIKETVEIFPEKILHPISPYIFGTNSNIIKNVTTATRFGGNRTTGYNWVNNYSNAGEDWYNSSDNYLPWIMQIPDKNQEDPGIVLTEFHDLSLNNNCFSLITLPMAGFVAKDKNGSVSETEKAPSKRWARVINEKGSSFTLSPKKDSDTIFIDECLNFLNQKYKSNNKINAYSLDNEPALWAYTHPRIHPEKVTVKELIQKSSDLASTIKKMQNDALVFGPALYGFKAYLDLQDAPDWNNFKSTYNRFIDAYLAEMKKESDKKKIRLIDVFDVHWYPEPNGVYNGDTSRDSSIRRMKAVRSLWDSSYIEDSWIGQWFAPVAILKYIKASINKYYPGTKIAITEYNYSGNNHISGGIAQADFLGVLAKEDVYFASKWDSISSYNASAFNIFRNYDGNYSKFGDLLIDNNYNLQKDISFYTSTNSNDSNSVHIIAINSNYDSTANITFRISSKKNFNNIKAWKFEANHSEITSINNLSEIVNNQINVILNPLSVNHFVLRAKVPSEINENDYFNELSISPNPSNDFINIILSKDIDFSNNSIVIYNALGEEQFSINENSSTFNSESHNFKIDISKFIPGIYFINYNSRVYKFIKY